MTREKIIERYKLELNAENQDLQHLDLSGLNLRGMSFRGSDLTDTSFVGANVRACNFVGCKGLDLTRRRIYGGSFYGRHR